MHFWWHAVCDVHKEECECFVNSPLRTLQLLSDGDTEIASFFERHGLCALRLVWKDEDLEAIEGYKKCMSASEPQTVLADPRLFVPSGSGCVCSKCGVRSDGELKHATWCRALDGETLLSEQKREALDALKAARAFMEGHQSCASVLMVQNAIESLEGE